MAELESQLPGTMLSCLQEQVGRIDGLQQDIDRLEARIAAWQKQDQACRAIADVPGIGRLTATALVATIGDAAMFKSGREFAAFLGLVPRQSGTGEGSTGLNLEARRSVFANAVDSRGAVRHVSHEGADALAKGNTSEATSQRRCCRTRKQDGSHGLGDSGARSGLPKKLRERETSVEGKRMQGALVGC